MTTTELKRQEAKETILKFSTRLNINDIKKELNKVEFFIKKELNFSKDLRKINYLNEQFLLRQYYKTLVNGL